MELELFWTDTAKKGLESVFNYYKRYANIEIAHNITNSIQDSVDILVYQPKMGQIEDLLRNRKVEYRYIVTGNYKVIYCIDDSYIKIAAIFDCRQNPQKLKTKKLK